MELIDVAAEAVAPIAARWRRHDGHLVGLLKGAHGSFVTIVDTTAARSSASRSCCPSRCPPGSRRASPRPACRRTATGQARGSTGRVASTERSASEASLTVGPHATAIDPLVVRALLLRCIATAASIPALVSAVERGVSPYDAPSFAADNQLLAFAVNAPGAPGDRRGADRGVPRRRRRGRLAGPPRRHRPGERPELRALHHRASRRCAGDRHRRGHRRVPPRVDDRPQPRGSSARPGRPAAGGRRAAERPREPHLALRLRARSRRGLRPHGPDPRHRGLHAPERRAPVRLHPAGRDLGSPLPRHDRAGRASGRRGGRGADGLRGQRERTAVIGLGELQARAWLLAAPSPYPATCAPADLSPVVRGRAHDLGEPFRAAMGDQVPGSVQLDEARAVDATRERTLRLRADDAVAAAHDHGGRNRDRLERVLEHVRSRSSARCSRVKARPAVDPQPSIARATGPEARSPSAATARRTPEMPMVLRRGSASTRSSAPTVPSTPAAPISTRAPGPERALRHGERDARPEGVADDRRTGRRALLEQRAEQLGVVEQPERLSAALAVAGPVDREDAVVVREQWDELQPVRAAARLTVHEQHRRPGSDVRDREAGWSAHLPPR